MRNTGRIGSDRVSFLFNATATKPITDLHVHVSVYYKYHVYKLFPVKLDENLCYWLNNQKGSFFMEWTLARALKYVKYDGELKCPIKGNLSISFSNVLLNKEFPLVPLVPSGKYRVDNIFTEASSNTVIASTQFFIEVSDNRIEKY